MIWVLRSDQDIGHAEGVGTAEIDVEQGDIGLFIVDERERGRGRIGGAEHMVARLLQESLKIHRNQRFVLDDENPRIAAIIH